MNRHPDPDRIDAQARAVHAVALEALSPRVHAQLAQRRHAALQGTTPARRRGLVPWAGVATAGLALALVLQWSPRPVPPRAVDLAAGAMPPSTAPRLAAAESRTSMPADADAIAPELAEDPDFYLWLGAVRPSNVE